MAVLVTGRFRILFDFFERVIGSLGANVGRHLIDFDKTVESGTGTDQADVIWSAERTTVAGTPDDLDLRGVLATALNSGINFTKASGFVIRNKSVTPGQTLTVGGDGVAAWFSGLFGSGAHTIKVGPGGAIAWYSGIDAAPVTATTNDILQIDGGANAITYQIGIIGRTV